MKKFINILVIVFVLGLVASCAKEEIIPFGENPNKKSGEVDVTSIGEGDKDDDGDVKDEEENDDGDITDPENDLDFD